MSTQFSVWTMLNKFDVKLIQRYLFFNVLTSIYIKTINNVDKIQDVCTLRRVGVIFYLKIKPFLT